MNDELKDAPLLRSIRAEDPFGVPEGFFDGFPTQVQARIAERNGVPRRFTWLAAPGWLRISGALGILALILGALVLLRPSPTAQDVAGARTIELTPDDLLLDRYEMTDLVRSIEEPEELMASIGQDLDRDDLAIYLENEELPLDVLIEEL